MLDALLADNQWAWALVFAIAFAESLIIVGFFVPGWLLLVAAGTLVGSGQLPFWPIVLSAYAGAVLGEGLGFWLGHRHSARVRDSKFLASHQPLLQRAERLFLRWGVWSLVVGRFIGPVRAVLPFVAGVLNFPLRLYWPTNLLTGLLWAPAYLLPGMFIGAAIRTSLADTWPALLQMLLAALALMLARQSWCARRTLAWLLLAVGLMLVLAMPFTASGAVLMQMIGTVVALMRIH